MLLSVIRRSQAVISRSEVIILRSQAVIRRFYMVIQLPEVVWQALLSKKLSKAVYFGLMLGNDLRILP